MEWSDSLAGEGVGMIIGDIPAGMLLRRYNHKWVMIVGLASLTVSVLALILDINVFTVIFFRIIAVSAQPCSACPGMPMWPT